MASEKVREVVLRHFVGNKMTLVGDFSQPVLAFLLLAVAMWEDLRSRKVPNQLLLVGLSLILVLIVLTQGFGGLVNSGLSFLTACVVVLPLYFLRVMGGGDVKLFVVISLLFSWQQVLLALFAAMIWGSLLGIFQVILQGQIMKFLHNLMALAQRVKLPAESTHKMPFTVALFFGFATSFFWVGL